MKSIYRKTVRKLIVVFLFAYVCYIKLTTQMLDVWVKTDTGNLPFIFTEDRYILNRFYSYDREFRFPSSANVSDIVKSVLRGEDISHIRKINRHPFKYIFTSHTICNHFQTTELRELFLMIIVKSSVMNFSLRNAIRKTWGSFQKESSVQLRFLLGFRREVQKIVYDEYNTYGDIIQEDFYDSYHNNTYKTIMGYNWIAQFCNNAKFIFFVDDDMFVNIEVVFEYFLNVLPEEEFTLFSGMLGSKSVPVRDSQSKWYVPWEDYPFDFYPPYLGGGAILTSQSVVQQFQTAFPYVKYFKIDDVYLGIVAKLLSITPTNNILLDSHTLRNFPKLKTLMANHGFDDSDLYIRTYGELHSQNPV